MPKSTVKVPVAAQSVPTPKVESRAEGQQRLERTVNEFKARLQGTVSKALKSSPGGFSGGSATFGSLLSGNRSVSSSKGLKFGGGRLQAKPNYQPQFTSKIGGIFKKIKAAF